MDEKTKVKCMDRLDKIISEFALRDFKRANPKPKFGKKTNPYSLGYETNEARELKNLLYGIPADQISLESETEVKAYLLKKLLHEDKQQ